MYKWLRVFFFLFFLAQVSLAQNEGFESDKNRFSVRFELIGNLIVVPMELNENQKFNFIVDTGSPYTIISDLNLIEELNIKKGNLISIGGLGHGKDYSAYDSKGNQLKIGKAYNNNAQVIILMDSPLDLSARMGMPIHGLIGFDAFRNFIVEINYRTKKLTFYKHSFFEKKKKRKLKDHQKVPLEFHQGKPYVRSNITIENDNQLPAKLLVDTGGWDAVWLFEDSHPEYSIPAKNFNDTLGFGLNGAITGVRSKIKNLQILQHKILRPTTSFPDSLSIVQVSKFKERNGSLGGEILRRFHVFFDYRNNALWLKKNKNFNKPFHYNMSGLNLVKPFLHVPIYEVAGVVSHSPAYQSGLRKGDFIHLINGFSPTKMSLAEIYNLFHDKPGKKIRITYERDGVKYKTQFILEDIL